MKIVYLITRSDAIGGACVHVRDLAFALRGLGHDATVLVGGAGPFTNHLTACGVPCVSITHLVRSFSPKRDFCALFNIVSVLRTLQPDLVCTHTAKAGWLGRVACAMLRIPVTFTAHGWSIGDRISCNRGYVYCFAEKFAAMFTHLIINVCESERDLALSRGVANAKKHVVVYNGIPDLPLELLADQVCHQPPRIVMTARMEHPKDHFTLLQALAGLRNYDWTLDLIGDGPLREAIHNGAEQLQLLPRIKFLGQITNVDEYLRRAQIFILCSRSEGLPLSILEAMRSGLPVIASDVGGIREAVLHGETGFVIQRSDKAAVQHALQLLVTTPELRVRMGQAGRQRYQDRFTFDQMLARTLEAYAEALCGFIIPRQTLGPATGH